MPRPSDEDDPGRSRTGQGGKASSLPRDSVAEHLAYQIFMVSPGDTQCDEGYAAGFSPQRDFPSPPVVARFRQATRTRWTTLPSLKTPRVGSDLRCSWTMTEP